MRAFLELIECHRAGVLRDRYLQGMSIATGQGPVLPAGGSTFFAPARKVPLNPQIAQLLKQDGRFNLLINQRRAVGTRGLRQDQIAAEYQRDDMFVGESSRARLEFSRAAIDALADGGIEDLGHVRYKLTGDAAR